MQKIPLLILFILTLSACRSTPAQNSDKTSGTKALITEFQKGDTMDKQEFWEIIDYSFSKSQQNSSLQEKLIIEKLATYSAEQIIDFEIILRQTINQADDFKVVALEKIIEGWVTDDPYLYFRCWLIGQGEHTFNETLKNPDFLADIVDKKTETSFESLLYVATEAYKIKTGKTEEDKSFPRDVAMKRDPQLDYDMGAPPTKGTDWKTEDLPKLYPRLWAKFH